MDIDQLITLSILGFAIVFFVTEWFRVDVVALSVVILLMLSEVITTEEAIAGFSDKVVLLIAALFIVGGGVFQTDLAGMIGRRILRIAGDSEPRLIATIMIATAILSGFMSDTGTVAVLLPAIVSLARNANISPSKLLIPLSFAALLGGAATLIGTPANVIVSDLMQKEGHEAFSFFSYTPNGFFLLLGGIGFMVLVGTRILPDYRTQHELGSAESPGELIDLYRVEENIFRLRIRSSSALVGKTIEATNLRSRFRVNILEILRETPPTQVVDRLLEQGRQQSRKVTVYPQPDTDLLADDILIVQGERADIQQAVAYWKLALQPQDGNHEQDLITLELGIAEVLVPPRSCLVGKTLLETRFRSTYNLTVLAIGRATVAWKLDLDNTAIRPGDVLLVQGKWQDILALKRHPRDFVVLGQPEASSPAPNREKAPVAFGVLMAMLVAIVAGVSPVVASMTAGLAMVLGGCLTMDEAYDAIDWKSIVLIAGMLPMSTALQKVGLVDEIAQGITSQLGDSSPLIVMAALFILTSVFTQVISNTATTVLVAPIALATALELGVRPHAFLMGVAVAASMAFASPVASPVNTLVMGAGNYSFSDYAKVGIPMIFLTLIITLIVVPLVFPF